jgi:hypothetical protein
MSRHGYCDDIDDQWATIRYMGALKSAMRGKKGQAFLRELRDALDALPEKCLISEELVNEEGDCCAMGAVALARGLDVSKVDPEEPEYVAAVFGINEKIAREIAYHNDDDYGSVTPQQRWQRMRNWVDRHIKPDVVAPPA